MRRADRASQQMRAAARDRRPCQAWRPIRGDGNCYYRAVLFAWLERCVALGSLESLRNYDATLRTHKQSAFLASSARLVHTILQGSGAATPSHIPNRAMRRYCALPPSDAMTCCRTCAYAMTCAGAVTCADARPCAEAGTCADAMTSGTTVTCVEPLMLAGAVACIESTTCADVTSGPGIGQIWPDFTPPKKRDKERMRE